MNEEAKKYFIPTLILDHWDFNDIMDELGYGVEYDNGEIYITDEEYNDVDSEIWIAKLEEYFDTTICNVNYTFDEIGGQTVILTLSKDSFEKCLTK